MAARKPRFWLNRWIALDILIANLLLLLTMTLLAYITVKVSFFNPFSRFIADFNINDLLYARLDETRGKFDTNVVLVNIGTLDRAGIAREIEVIRKFKPRVIGYDGIFAVRKDSASDAFLRQQLQAEPRVVMACYLTGEKEIKGQFDSLETSIPYFNSKRLAHVNQGGADRKLSTVRKFSPSVIFRNDTLYAMSAVLARAYDPDAFSRLKERKSRWEIINYIGNTPSFMCFDPEDILDSNVDLSVIRDKIVLMGYIGPSYRGPTDLEDIYFTPMNGHLTGRSLPDMYGVVIHANCISMILTNDFIDTMPWWLTLFLVFMVSYFYIMLLCWYGSKKAWHYHVFLPMFLLLLNLFIVYAFFQAYKHLEYNIPSGYFMAPLLLFPTFKTYYERFLSMLNKKIKIHSIFLLKD
jgi:CHASE2 domain-containing sensor protein